MTTPLKLPGREEIRPGQIDIELKRVLAYGPHYSIKRWEERPEGQQLKITNALCAFRTWRIRRGESFDHASPWEMTPPSVETLRVYLALLSTHSVPWRDSSVAALRLYFLHLEMPQLFRLVKVKLVA